jgi:response regulator RpfG family c-di-GMP phosphodiesterase
MDCDVNDVILVDMEAVPRLAREMIAELRKRDRSVPVVLVSSAWPEPSWLHAFAPIGYLRKPFSPGDLQRVISSLMSDVQVARLADRRGPGAGPNDEAESTIGRMVE